MKEIFITGLGNVSPQKTFDNSGFLEEVVSSGSNLLKCQDPNYKEFVPADMLRRMSRIIKFGVAAGKICLADAGCSMPDAIITGTGLGCIEDTEKFLSNLIKCKEEFLTPTSFIQSTHNTVSAQIALLLKCHNYNFTFVHRGLSFESALLDSTLQLDGAQAETVLLGGMDEMTINTFQILQRLGQVKQKAIDSLQLIRDKTRGSIAGEGSAFFLLSSKPGAKNYAKISAPDMFYNPVQDEIKNRLVQFLDKNGRTLKDVDLVLLGMNGDPKADNIYHELTGNLPTEPALGYYKHLCGEYFTSSAFGLWLASKILHHHRIPEIVSIRNSHSSGLRTILLYNHYRNSEHSFILVTAP
jgi:3-oxoacyl-[acyl-carrier-protein] synthase II